MTAVQFLSQMKTMHVGKLLFGQHKWKWSKKCSNARIAIALEWYGTMSYYHIMPGIILFFGSAERKNQEFYEKRSTYRSWFAFCRSHFFHHFTWNKEECPQIHVAWVYICHFVGNVADLARSKTSTRMWKQPAPQAKSNWNNRVQCACGWTHQIERNR